MVAGTEWKASSFRVATPERYVLHVKHATKKLCVWSSVRSVVVAAVSADWEAFPPSLPLPQRIQNKNRVRLLCTITLELRSSVGSKGGFKRSRWLMVVSRGGGVRVATDALFKEAGNCCTELEVFSPWSVEGNR